MRERALMLTMMPQIKFTRCPGLAIALALCATLLFPALAHAQATTARPTPVKTHTVIGGGGEARIEAVGSLLADEAVMLRPEIAGRIVAFDFTEGATVTKGHVLARLDDATYQAQLRQVEAELGLLGDRLRRAESLYAQQFLSEQAVIDARQNLIRAQAKRDEVRTALAKTRLSAPFAGVVGLRQVSVGAYVKEGDDIVGLSKIDRLKLDLRVPETHLARLRQVGGLDLSVDAWPGRTFTARILAIDPQVDPATRTLLVRARVDNPNAQLKPGMFARVQARLPAPAGVRIPEEAVLARPGQFLVYRIEDGTAKPVQVKPGPREPGWVWIAQGLRAGDVIVREGHLKLKPGAPVQVLGSAPN